MLIRSNSPIFRRTFSLMVIMVLLVTASGSVAASASPSRSLPAASSVLPPGGTLLPVFQFAKPQVTGAGTQTLAALFPPLAEQEVHEDPYLGNARFTVGNEKTGTLLQQYSATGGFYAYNPVEAYSETPRGKLDVLQAQLQACRFLVINQLVPDPAVVSVGDPTLKNCDYNFTPETYHVIPAYTNQGTMDTTEKPVLIALIVQLPMALNIGRLAPNAGISQIPLSGPGGHLSLLFRTTEDDNGFSLDPNTSPSSNIDLIPGLASVALPFYGRSVSLKETVPSRDPAKVKQAVLDAVRANFPEGTPITVPDPQLTYWVSDAAQPQMILEPTYEFDGITATVDGQDIVLKDVTMPAVEGGPNGLGPTVMITAPANASNYRPGTPVNLVGTVADGTAPYHYTWSLVNDGSTLKEGDLNAAGDVSATGVNIPSVSHSGTPSPAQVVLTVTDADGVTRSATITLNALVAPSIWLPILGMGSLSTAGTSQGQAVDSRALVKPDYFPYSFGIESGSDYPPYGPGGSDLPGVPPDANGFRSGLLGYGWRQTFYWSNASAWEKDWRDVSLGGIDSTWGVDRVDFAYYTGHGSNGGIYLPSSVDAAWFPGTKARFQNVRWVGFSSCLTLRAQWADPAMAPIRNWFNAFQGAHMLLGFNSVMADIAFGPRLVDNMRIPTFLGLFEMPWAQLTIREAWVHTAFTMNAGKPAYIYAVGANGVNPVNDKLPKGTDPALPRPYPVSSWHWVWWNE